MHVVNRVLCESRETQREAVYAVARGSRGETERKPWTKLEAVIKPFMDIKSGLKTKNMRILRAGNAFEKQTRSELGNAYLPPLPPWGFGMG
jgi:hypothetical protein